jgi:hypothetical protein
MIEQKIKPNKEILKLKDIVTDAKTDPAKAENNLESSETTPKVFYYDLELPASYIRKITLDSNRFMPICYVEFEDVYNILHDVGFPADNAKLTIIIPSNSKILANIYMEFKIERFNVVLSRSGNKKIMMWGICNVENMLVSPYRSYENTSTFDLCKNIAQETGLGLMSNVDSSKDSMNWINTSIPVYQFLQDTINKAWVGESGYIWGFVDFYYNLNYIDVERSLSQDITEIQWVHSSQMPDKPVTDKDLILPILSNGDNLRSSNTYFLGEKIINKSTETSINRGYIRNIHYYDIDGKWDSKAGAYKVYGLDTITTQGSENSTVYLKGDPGNLDFYNKHIVDIYLDKIDTKNMYPDYLWAKVQNEENLHDLQKISMEITLPTPNFNLRRFEKVRLVFVNPGKDIVANKSHVALNGEWLVTGISYEWNGTSLYQFANLVKRELTINEL